MSLCIICHGVYDNTDGCRTARCIELGKELINYANVVDYNKLAAIGKISNVKPPKIMDWIQNGSVHHEEKGEIVLREIKALYPDVKISFKKSSNQAHQHLYNLEAFKQTA